MVSALKWFNTAIRALMELGVVVGFGFWGFKTGNSTFSKILLGIGTPMLGFGFWGLVDFRRAGSLSEPLRLIQELTITGLAALALYVAGARAWGLALVTISIVHHALVYLLGGTLLKH